MVVTTLRLERGGEQNWTYLFCGEGAGKHSGSKCRRQEKATVGWGGHAGSSGAKALGLWARARKEEAPWRGCGFRAVAIPAGVLGGSVWDGGPGEACPGGSRP